MPSCTSAPSWRTGLLILLALVFPIAVAVLWKTIISSCSYDLHAAESARATMSEASWLRSVRQRHEWMEENYDYNANLFSPRDESVRLWYTLWDLFPATYTCPWDMQRIGRLGDGGKWICGMSKYAAHHSPGRPLRLYSFGVGSDSSFEGQFLNESSRAEVWGFDYSVPMWGQGLEGRAANSDRMHFAKVGIASHDYYDDTIKAQLFSIGSIMDKLGHDYVDLIKMDIEGDEFPVLDSFLKEFKGKELPVGQLVIEIHVPEEGLTISQFANWWERLEGSGMRPVWSEANLLAVTVGNEKPCCVEYTWVNSKDSRSILWR